MHQDFLVTKFSIPAQSPSHVVRPRLFQLLDDGLRLGRRLVLVAAPAGYGKTTLISGWIQRHALDTAWISLEESDNDPVRFFSYLVGAIQLVRPETAAALSLPLPPGGPFEPHLVSLLNELASIKNQFAIVFDDYHVIQAQVIHDALAFMIQNLPAQVHVVVATRADPPLPLARWRARGQLLELRLRELRFNSEEAGNFIQAAEGLPLSTGEISSLNNQIEGWAAGLQMAALSLRARMAGGESPASPSRFSTLTVRSRYILDYFSEEVLERLPGSILNFLRQTSILERLCGSLCDEVVGFGEAANGDRKGILTEQTPSGAAILDYLERQNLFILPLDERRDWYRYHRLFADLLSQQLVHRQPEIVPLLHRRASAWFARRQLWDEAISHAFAAGDQERAADLIQTAAEATLMRSEMDTFRRWVDQLPDTELNRRPDLAVYLGITHLWGGASLEAIENDLERIEKNPASAGRAAPLRAYIALNRGQIPQARSFCLQALESIPECDHLLRGLAELMHAIVCVLDGETDRGIVWLEKAAISNRESGNLMMAALFLYQLAELHQKEGHLRQAMMVYQRALELMTDNDGRHLPLAGRALVGLGEIAWARNELQTARSYVLQGIELSEKWSHVSTFDGYMALVAILLSQRDMQEAVQAVKALREIALQYDITDVDDQVVDLLEARLNLIQGDLEAVKRWVRLRGIERRPGEQRDGFSGTFLEQRLRKYEILVAARLWLAEGKPELVLAFLDPQLAELDKIERPALLIETKLLRALAFQEMNESAEAVSALEHALILAEPEGYKRLFIDPGEPLKALLWSARSRIKRGTLRSFLDEILLAYQSEEKQPQARLPGEIELLVEPLSQRETQVLKLLPSSLSSQELADELYISIHTLRSHLKSIYEKLGVHSRLEAIEKANQLNLL